MEKVQKAQSSNINAGNSISISNSLIQGKHKVSKALTSAERKAKQRKNQDNIKREKELNANRKWKAEMRKNQDNVKKESKYKGPSSLLYPCDCRGVGQYMKVLHVTIKKSI